MLRKCTFVATFGTRYCFSPSEKGRHGEDETTLAYVRGIRKSRILVPRHRCQRQRLTMKFISSSVAKLLCRARISQRENHQQTAWKDSFNFSSRAQLLWQQVLLSRFSVFLVQESAFTIYTLTPCANQWFISLFLFVYEQMRIRADLVGGYLLLAGGFTRRVVSLVGCQGVVIVMILVRYDSVQ